MSTPHQRRKIPFSPITAPKDQRPPIAEWDSFSGLGSDSWPESIESPTATSIRRRSDRGRLQDTPPPLDRLNTDGSRRHEGGPNATGSGKNRKQQPVTADQSRARSQPYSRHAQRKTQILALNTRKQAPATESYANRAYGKKLSPNESFSRMPQHRSRNKVGARKPADAEDDWQVSGRQNPTTLKKAPPDARPFPGVEPTTGITTDRADVNSQSGKSKGRSKRLPERRCSKLFESSIVTPGGVPVCESQETTAPGTGACSNDIKSVHANYASALNKTANEICQTHGFNQHDYHKTPVGTKKCRLGHADKGRSLDLAYQLENQSTFAGAYVQDVTSTRRRIRSENFTLDYNAPFLLACSVDKGDSRKFLPYLP